MGVANLVEVYAFFDAATASYTATRIELKANLADFKLVGPVAALNTAAKTFTIGGATIGYAGVPGAALPPLSNGLVVRVHVQTVRQGTVWVATSLAADAPAVADGAETKVEGFVTDFTSAASFKVGGVAVNAAGPGVTFKSGSAAQLANGVRVEVEGVTRAGVLAAASVDVKTSGGGDQQFELHGAVEAVNRGPEVHADSRRAPIQLAERHRRNAHLVGVAASQEAEPKPGSHGGRPFGPDPR